MIHKTAGMKDCNLHEVLLWRPRGTKAYGWSGLGWWQADCMMGCLGTQGLEGRHGGCDEMVFRDYQGSLAHRQSEEDFRHMLRHWLPGADESPGHDPHQDILQALQRPSYLRHRH